MSESPNKLWLTVICFHISAVLYVLVGILLLVIFANMEDGDRMNMPIGVIGLIVSWVVAAAVEVVVYGLKQRKMWGWVTGLVICALYIPSLFFPLGALALWGLLDSGTRAEFGMGPPAGPVNQNRPRWPQER